MKYDSAVSTACKYLVVAAALELLDAVCYCIALSSRQLWTDIFDPVRTATFFVSLAGLPFGVMLASLSYQSVLSKRHFLNPLGMFNPLVVEPRAGKHPRVRT